MAVIEAYLDESGTHNSSRITCSAGYLFSLDGASGFEKDWKPFLASKGLTAFHANDCYQRDDAAEIFENLISLIKRTALRGVLRFAKKNVIDSMSEKRFTGSPYTMCTLSCMERMAELAKESNHEIVYFIESGNEFGGELRHFLNLIKENNDLKKHFAMAGADTYDKDQIIQLQAGDLLGWEFGRAYNNAIVSKREEWRDSLKQLVELPHHFSGFSEISAWIQAMINSVNGLESNRTKWS
jgi:hypothetical protein